MATRNSQQPQPRKAKQRSQANAGTQDASVYVRILDRRQLEAIEHYMLEADSANGRGWIQLVKLLESAKTDEVVAASPGALAFVEVMIELAGDAVTDHTSEQTLKRLHSIMSNRGGGRPTKMQTFARWQEMVQDHKKSHPILSMREVYEDIAAQWQSEGHPEVKWTAIRDGCSQFRQAQKASK